MLRYEPLGLLYLPCLRWPGGVDLSQIFDKEINLEGGPVVSVWTRNAMGLRPSPYGSMQGSLEAKQLVLGDPKHKSNLYNCSWVRENMPQDADNNPIIPWVSKVRPDGRIALDLHIYVDDCGITAACRELAWQAASQ
jgi:hypothetical protein